jgi:hypothetical protein
MITGTPTAAGTFTVPVSVTVSFGSVVSGTLTLIIGEGAPDVPVISTPMGVTAIINQSYGLVLSASNSPTSFSATGLPPGLSLDPATGVISGVPNTVNTFPLTVTATNAAGSASATLKLLVASISPLAYNLTSPGPE